MSENTEGKVLIGVIEINEAKRLKEKLLKKNLSVELIHNDETCKKSYVSKVEVWAQEEDLEKVQRVIHDENME
ncbi:MAG: hypothetical protein WCQ53_08985, partial [bacterium]